MSQDPQQVSTPAATKRAAVAYIERADGRLLCVWNRRYGGWSFPGGLVEEGETVLRALVRELTEETSMRLVGALLMYDGPVGAVVTEPAGGPRGSHVYVFRVEAEGVPREMEPSCPVTWLLRDEFLKWTPFRDFYDRMFNALEERSCMRRLFEADGAC